MHSVLLVLLVLYRWFEKECRTEARTGQRGRALLGDHSSTLLLPPAYSSNNSSNNNSSDTVKHETESMV